MLVLSRKPNQKIQIGNEITITVVKVRGNVIRLGIDAPRDVRVIRAELDLTIDEAMASGIVAVDETNGEPNDGPSDEPVPSPSNISFARYTQPEPAQSQSQSRGLSSVMKKKALAS